MINFLYYLFIQPSPQLLQIALCFMRIGIGAITLILGIPKMSGPATWINLGQTFMFPLGIRFLPIVWGFLGGCSQFFGGIALALGLGTRIGSFCLIVMMIIAVLWHLKRGDPFQVYSYPLSLIFVYSTFLIIGAGNTGLDIYFVK